MLYICSKQMLSKHLFRGIYLLFYKDRAPFSGLWCTLAEATQPEGAWSQSWLWAVSVHRTSRTLTWASCERNRCLEQHFESLLFTWCGPSGWELARASLWRALVSNRSSRGRSRGLWRFRWVMNKGWHLRMLPDCSSELERYNTKAMLNHRKGSV